MDKMFKHHVRKRLYADDATEGVGLLLRLRLPWLLIGLSLSMGTALLVSHFEHILSSDPRLVFFIPLIIYMSDSVGTQTATIYIRNLGQKQAKFRTYIIKELLVGVSLGIVFGLLSATVARYWLDSKDVALTIGFAMWASLTTATVFALVTTAIVDKLNIDPASGVDPLVSVAQDVISLSIYFAIATLIIF